MTPKQADKLIEARIPVLVRNDRYREQFWTILVSRDRFGVRSIDGGLFDRGELKLVTTGTRSAFVKLETVQISLDSIGRSLLIPFGHGV